MRAALTAQLMMRNREDHIASGCKGDGQGFENGKLDEPKLWDALYA